MAKKIIVAEDQESIRNICSLYFKQIKDLEFDLCENAEELLEKMRNARYDLVITDNDMGTGIKGVEAIRRIRESDKIIPIYLMSARKEIEQEALQAGATGYISKPLGLGEFLRQLIAGNILADLHR
jgi:CheY-like chemotaxis protein